MRLATPSAGDSGEKVEGRKGRILGGGHLLSSGVGASLAVVATEGGPVLVRPQGVQAGPGDLDH